MKIKAWDTERKQWVPCSSLKFDHDRKLWLYVQHWSDGDEDWLYDVEIYIDGEWRKLNDEPNKVISTKTAEQAGKD